MTRLSELFTCVPRWGVLKLQTMVHRLAEGLFHMLSSLFDIRYSLAANEYRTPNKE
jgi:hypothetical protein